MYGEGDLVRSACSILSDGIMCLRLTSSSEILIFWWFHFCPFSANILLHTLTFLCLNMGEGVLKSIDGLRDNKQ